MRTHKRSTSQFVRCAFVSSTFPTPGDAGTDAKMEKEAEGSSYFEVDDARCRDGQYDIKLDKDFKITSMTRD